MTGGESSRLGAGDRGDGSAPRWSSRYAPGGARGGTREVAEAIAAGPPVDRVLVTVAGGRTATPEETTPAGLVDLVERRLAHRCPGASFVGGTEIYFTELNRTRPEHATWDGICYSARRRSTLSRTSTWSRTSTPGRDSTELRGRSPTGSP